jgi:hypothetical protein
LWSEKSEITEIFGRNYFVNSARVINERMKVVKKGIKTLLLLIEAKYFKNGIE